MRKGLHVRNPQKLTRAKVRFLHAYKFPQYILSREVIPFFHLPTLTKATISLHQSPNSPAYSFSASVHVQPV